MLMLLYIVLHIMLAYLMLFAALPNTVCSYNAFFAIDFCKCFLLTHSLFISSMIFHQAQFFYSVAIS